jgi:glycosyltransferase involved in cell wall biosynthesis
MRFAEFLKDQNIIEPRHFIKKPLVSVIMPTYCRAHDGLLSQAITGVLTQTFSDLEFIILDDGSIDGSEVVIRDFQQQDDRILYVRHEINSGLPVLRVNEGILLSKGDYIAFQFDDDIWLSHFLENVTRESMKRNRSFVHCQAKYLLGSDVFSPSFPIMQPTHASLLQRNTIANVSVLLHKSVFKSTGLYDPHVVLRRITDWDLWVRIAKQEPPYLLPEVLVCVQGGLPDSIGIQAPWIEYEDFTLFFHVYRDIDLTPERIMDIDVISLDRFYGKLPRQTLYRIYNNQVVSWLKHHKEEFADFGIVNEDIKTLDIKMHTLKAIFFPKKMIKNSELRVLWYASVMRKVIKRLFPRMSKFLRIAYDLLFFMFTSWRQVFYDAWNSLPPSFMEIKNDPFIRNYRSNGFSLKKSVNLEHCNSIPYQFTVQGGDLYTLSLAFSRSDNNCYGSVGVAAIFLEDKSVSHAITSVSNVSEEIPTTFFFEPPLKPGQYSLRIFGNHLKAPICIYELHKYKWMKIIRQAFCKFGLVGLRNRLPNIFSLVRK